VQEEKSNSIDETQSDNVTIETSGLSDNSTHQNNSDSADIHSEDVKPFEPDASPPSSDFEQVITGIQSLFEAFHSLEQSFDSKIKYDDSKERIIDSLHNELQTCREGMHFKIMRPLFFDLMAMHDDLTNLLKYHKNSDSNSETLSKLLQSMASFQYTIESILEHHGVVAYNQPDDQFFPQRQRALRTELTDDPTKDRLVYEHLHKGFEYEGKVLRPETVSLYKFIGSSNPDNTPKEVLS
jgi:molecular chaperone GrpE